MVQQLPVSGSQYPANTRFPTTADSSRLTADSLRLDTRYWVLLFFPGMWGLRWTARFLLLVMLAPAFGPLALARAAQSEAMHCVRQPVAGHPGQSAMPCHHAMAPATQADFSDSSFHAANGCCENHDCCRGATTSEWAQPASNLLPFVSLLIEPTRPGQSAVFYSSNASGCDSARAPPCS